MKTKLHTTIQKWEKQYLTEQAEKQGTHLNTILTEAIQLHQKHEQQEIQNKCIKTTFIDLLRPEIRRVVEEELDKRKIRPKRKKV